MAAEKGRAFLLKIGNGGAPETFTTIGGLRATSLTINNEVVDTTNKSSAGWRELLAGAGIRAVSVAGGGVFTGSAAEGLMRGHALTGAIANYEVVFESGDKFSGAFYIVSLEFAGDHNGERTYSLRLDSSGAVAYAAA